MKKFTCCPTPAGFCDELMEVLLGVVPVTFWITNPVVGVVVASPG